MTLLSCIQAERSDCVCEMGEFFSGDPCFVCECIKDRVHCAVQIFDLLKLAQLTKGFAGFSLLDAPCARDM